MPFFDPEPVLGVPFNDCFRIQTVCDTVFPDFTHSSDTLRNSLGLSLFSIHRFLGSTIDDSLLLCLTNTHQWGASEQTISESALCSCYLFPLPFLAPHTDHTEAALGELANPFLACRGRENAFSNNQLLQRLRFLCNHFFFVH